MPHDKVYLDNIDSLMELLLPVLHDLDFMKKAHIVSAISLTD